MTEKLTKKQEAELSKWFDHCLDIGSRTTPGNHQVAEEIITKLYQKIDQPAPKFIWGRSPREVATIKVLDTNPTAGWIARAIHWDAISEKKRQKIRDANMSDDAIYSQLEIYWIGYYKFCQQLGVSFTPEQTEMLELWYQLAQNVFYWYPYEGTCYCSESPISIKWDEEGRLHNPTGPAVEFADGFAVYSFQGVTIPGGWVRGEFPPAEELLHWENMEQRRVGCELYGWEKLLRGLNCTTIDKDPNEEIGELLSVEIPDSGTEQFLRVKCGTGRYFAIPVPPDVKTALEANAATYGLQPDFYKPEVRT